MRLAWWREDFILWKWGDNATEYVLCAFLYLLIQRRIHTTHFFTQTNLRVNCSQAIRSWNKEPVKNIITHLCISFRPLKCLSYTTIGNNLSLEMTFENYRFHLCEGHRDIGERNFLLFQLFSTYCQFAVVLFHYHVLYSDKNFHRLIVRFWNSHK